jgi:hypothetical protein
MAQQRLKLFQWHDTLIVANDERDARALLREQRDLDGRSLRPYPVKRVRRSVELCNTSDHDHRVTYTPSEAARACGRGVIPDVS